ncbi:hypothetical protein P175DRAFT_0559197 [Aspergillus ochraceoroseus IBT 24754]|uniref:Uncharacterized protein n=1 Tax=Aspergillus ochraceoroseus IBT 24754 TaxID=1392256 RepID=A0A2T5LTN4_9EURO|nr:uncharacterized protein P175DRAFT_0559197 [Aspergillus ochraceoroseus IBT 24754]PTU19641.1 hypothetical protein P175DRAFT_0559197 [Aspergillus ochraceoroseus IBT 24754]
MAEMANERERWRGEGEKEKGRSSSGEDGGKLKGLGFAVLDKDEDGRGMDAQEESGKCGYSAQCLGPIIRLQQSFLQTPDSKHGYRVLFTRGLNPRILRGRESHNKGYDNHGLSEQQQQKNQQPPSGVPSQILDSLFFIPLNSKSIPLQGGLLILARQSHNPVCLGHRSNHRLLLIASSNNREHASPFFTPARSNGFSVSGAASEANNHVPAFEALADSMARSGLNLLLFDITMVSPWSTQGQW